MKPPRHIFPLVALLAGLGLAVSTAAAVNESALIRQHIDALLKRRQKPEPLPVDPPNPFAMASSVAGLPLPAREPTPGNVNPPAPAPAVDKGDDDAGSATTAELLARLSARLRITGIIRVKNQLNIIINDNPWKEGDYLVINQGARILRLQVAHIQPGQLTLRLEDAEMVLRF